MVAAHQFSAGALNEKTFKRLVGQGKRLKILASFPSPAKPWLARAGLPPRIRDAITTALLNLKEEKALKALSYQGFLPGDDSDYEMVRRAIRQNQTFFE